MHDPAANKALMRRIFDGIAEADGRLFYEHLADDAVMVITGQQSWSRRYEGKAAIAEQVFRRVRQRLGNNTLRTRAFRFLADEDWVVVEARGDMARNDGTPYCNDYCLLYRLRDGRIVEAREYQDSTLAEQVLGRYDDDQAPALAVTASGD